MRRTLSLVACVLVIASGLRVLLVEAPAFGAPIVPPSADAGRSDAAVLDGGAAAPRSSCRVELDGGGGVVSADLDCQVTRRDSTYDGGTVLVLTLDTPRGASDRDPEAHVGVVCFGKPPLGYQSGDTYPGCLSADAKVSQRAVDWVGISGGQGTFTLLVTSVRTIKVGGRDTYEVHGVLAATLPVSNTFLPPVDLRATF